MRGLRGVVVAVMFGSLALTTRTAAAAGVTPAAATPVQREQAQGRFLKGRDLYAAKKYATAIVELEASIDIVASPNTRLTLGRCLRDTGRTVAAYVEFGRTAVEARELVRDDVRYEKAGAAAAEERALLAPQLGFVEVSVLHAGADTTLKVSGETVRRGGWDEPLPVLPGTSDILVETPGHATGRQALTIAAGERKTVTIDAQAETAAEASTAVAAAPAAAERPPTLRPIAFAAAGVGVAGLATFIVAGTLANGTHSDLETACGAGRCPAGYEADISRGTTQQTFANVGLAVAAIAAVKSVTLFIVGPPKRASSAVATGPGFMTVRGTF